MSSGPRVWPPQVCTHHPSCSDSVHPSIIACLHIHPSYSSGACCNGSSVKPPPCVWRAAFGRRALRRGAARRPPPHLPRLPLTPAQLQPIALTPPRTPSAPRGAPGPCVTARRLQRLPRPAAPPEGPPPRPVSGGRVRGARASPAAAGGESGGRAAAASGREWTTGLQGARRRWPAWPPAAWPRSGAAGARCRPGGGSPPAERQAEKALGQRTPLRHRVPQIATERSAACRPGPVLPSRCPLQAVRPAGPPLWLRGQASHRSRRQHKSVQLEGGRAGVAGAAALPIVPAHPHRPAAPIALPPPTPPLTPPPSAARPAVPDPRQGGHALGGRQLPAGSRLQRRRALGGLRGGLCRAAQRARLAGSAGGTLCAFTTLRSMRLPCCPTLCSPSGRSTQTIRPSRRGSTSPLASCTQTSLTRWAQRAGGGAAAAGAAAAAAAHDALARLPLPQPAPAPPTLRRATVRARGCPAGLLEGQAMRRAAASQHAARALRAAAVAAAALPRCHPPTAAHVPPPSSSVPVHPEPQQGLAPLHHSPADPPGRTGTPPAGAAAAVARGGSRSPTWPPPLQQPPLIPCR